MVSPRAANKAIIISTIVDSLLEPTARAANKAKIISTIVDWNKEVTNYSGQ